MSDRPCVHCGLGNAMPHVHVEPKCPGYEPDKVCTSHYPMPTDPAPYDLGDWTHNSLEFQGIDPKTRERHALCPVCGTRFVSDEEGNLLRTAPPGRVAPPPGRKVTALPTRTYGPAQLFADAQEWVDRQPVRAAVTVLLINNGDGDPQAEILWSEADLPELSLLSSALRIAVDGQIFRRAIPHDDSE